MSRKLVREVERYLEQGAHEGVIRDAIRARYPAMPLDTVERYLSVAKANIEGVKTGRSLAMSGKKSRGFVRYLAG